jgi:hypothetical protein
MALSLDGHATGGNSASASTTVTLTTTNANDVIIVQAVGVNASGAITVSSVTASGLTFTKRKALVFATNDTIELWWAIAAAPLSAKVITVNWSSSVSAANVAALCAFGVSGADTRNPWDPDASLPATATGSNSVPTVSGVSTDSPDTILLGLSAELTALTETAGSGFTLIDSTTQGAVTAADEYQVVSGPQSSVSVAFGTTTTASWSMIADAIEAAFPFNQYDWPLPQRPVWYKSWELNLQLSTLYPIYTPRSPVYTPRITREFYRDWSLNLVLTYPSGKPFKQTEWPLPGRREFYRDWSQNLVLSQLVGKDRIYGPPGMVPDYDWPLPGRREFYRDWSQNLVLRFPSGKPFNQQDWPNPVPPRYWDRFYSQSLALFFSPPPNLPFNQADWPVPPRTIWFKDWAQNLVLTYPSREPFYQTDWPLPGRWPLATAYRDWSQNLVLIRPSGKPFNQQHWPNPARLEFYRDWSQNLALRAAVPTPFSQYDWPLPIRLNWFKDWGLNLQQSTLAPVPVPPPDAAQPQPPFVRDWYDRDEWGHFVPGAGMHQSASGRPEPPPLITTPWRVDN